MGNFSELIFIENSKNGLTKDNIEFERYNHPISADPKDFGKTTLNPGQGGEILTNNISISWFLHITDTQSIWTKWDDTKEFDEFFNTTVAYILPKFVINTGDLVDSDYKGFFREHGGQRPEEWMNYSLALQRNKLNQSNYYDMAGNHDSYDNGQAYYLNYSMQKKLYYDFFINSTDSNGNYQKIHFIVINAPEDRGIKYPLALFGYMNSTELDWYEKILKNNQDANLTITLGHMPAYEILEGNHRFFKLNKKYGVDLYLCGHGHENSYQYVDNYVVSYETKIFSEEPNNYRIISIENGVIGTSTGTVGEWPMGIITYPSAEQNLYGDFKIDGLKNTNELHVLAWDPKGLNKVEWRATLYEDNEDSWSDWKTLSRVQINTTSLIEKSSFDLKNKNIINTTSYPSPLFSGPWNPSLNDGEKHIIEVRIFGESGMKIISIIYSTERAFHFGWVYKRPLITIAVAAVFLGTPAFQAIGRKKGWFDYPNDYNKRDPVLWKLWLTKLVVLLILPLSIIPAFTQSTVLMFWWGYLGKMGAMVYYVNLLFFTGILFTFNLIIPGLNLSPRKRYWMFLIVMPLSLGTTGLLIWTFFKLFGGIALIAPGYYCAIIIDLICWLRAVKLIKEKGKERF